MLTGLADLRLLLGQVALVHQGDFRLLPSVLPGALGTAPAASSATGVQGDPRPPEQLRRGHAVGGRHGLPVPP